jgi:hypothetical protein
LLYFVKVIINDMKDVFGEEVNYKVTVAEPGMVAQTYNQSYSGGSDCEGSSSRSAWAKSS